MKHGKNPTREQRKFLMSKRVNAEDWLVCKDTPTEMVLTHRHFDGKMKIVPKPRKEDFYG